MIVFGVDGKKESCFPVGSESLHRLAFKRGRLGCFILSSITVLVHGLPLASP